MIVPRKKQAKRKERAATPVLLADLVQEAMTMVTAIALLKRNLAVMIVLKKKQQAIAMEKRKLVVTLVLLEGLVQEAMTMDTAMVIAIAQLKRNLVAMIVRKRKQEVIAMEKRKLVVILARQVALVQVATIMDTAMVLRHLAKAAT